MPTRITLKMIATKAGVHITTVSMALRDHPGLAEATRHRIKAIAAEMGYTRDPLLSALVAYRTTNRPAVEQGVIAWVDVWTTPKGARDEFPELWQGAFENARKLGWRLEEFRPLHEGISLPQFSRILRARGIEGLIIPPLPTSGLTEIELEWPWFSAVTTSHTLMAPRLHSIVTNQGRNMRTICDKIYSLGYRKPGLVLAFSDHPTVTRNWFRSYVGLQYCVSNPTDMIPPLEPSQFDAAEFMAWFDRYRPDALVVLNPSLYITVLKAAKIKIPEDIVIGVPRPSDESRGSLYQIPEVNWSINECWAEIGQHTVNILVGMLHRGEKGVPKVPMTISVDGVLLDRSPLAQVPVQA